MTNNKLTDEHVAGYAKYGTGLGYDDRHIQEMARRLLTAEAALKEYRKGAGEPVAWMVIDSDSGEKFIRTDRSNIEGAAMPLYTAPQQAPAVEVRPIAFFDGDISPADAEKLAAAIRELNNAPSEPAILAAVEAVPDDVSGPLAYAYKELTPQFMRNHIRCFERYGIIPRDDSTVIQALRIALDGMERRAAMHQLFGNSEHVSNRDELPATKIKPVADLYGITSPTGSETSFTFDAIEARNFIDGGWSCQEYVELERFQQACADNSPEIPDWQDKAEKMAELHGSSFVEFRNGESPQCADPSKVIISFADEGLGHCAAAPQQEPQ